MPHHCPFVTRGHTGTHGDALRPCSLRSPGTSRSQQLAATGLPHALLAKSCSSAGRAPTSSPGRTSQMNKNLPRAVSVPVHSFGWHIRVTEGFFSTLPRYRTVSVRLRWQSTWSLTRSFPMNFTCPQRYSHRRTLNLKTLEFSPCPAQGISFCPCPRPARSGHFCLCHSRTTVAPAPFPWDQPPAECWI